MNNNKKRRLNSPEELTDYIKYEDNKITYYRGYKNDPKSFKIHRDERDRNGLTLPAMIKYDPYVGENIVKYWYNNGLLHRDEWEGPAVMGANKVWYNHGQVHRINGPAIIYEDGFMMVWYQYNRVHREDGPAVLSASFKDYYLFGRKLNKTIFYNIIRRVSKLQNNTRKKYINKIKLQLNKHLCDDLKNSIISYILG